jgi:hypothetical protein
MKCLKPVRKPGTNIEKKRGLSPFFFAWLILISCIAFECIAGEAVSQVSGVVVDTGNSPVNNAKVCVQGNRYCVQTDTNGRFHLSVDTISPGTNITAGKFGFYNGARPFMIGIKPVTIVLRPVPQFDNTDYQWLPSLTSGQEKQTSGLEENQPCQVCHPKITQEWQQDAHSNAAKNAIFLSFFNGTDVNGEKSAGPGYTLDFPNSSGNCAACHVPALALENPLHADPNKVEGVAEEGIFCDFCHKIRGVEIDHTGGKPGVMSIDLHRPSTGYQIFYGPFSDVYPGDDGYHPLYKKSHYCAPCHHGKFWDVLIYSEFQEWLDSSYRERDIHCQDCHMPATGDMRRFALEEKGGIVRDPSTLASHGNLGIQDTGFMKEAVELKIRAGVGDKGVNVTVAVKNTKAGHHYPTGNPMRNMILLVEVKDDDRSSLFMTQGETVPVWGGVGPVKDGNYAGLPGKGFAKVLKDAVLYPDKRVRHFSPEYPAPHWRPVYIESDNRIPADGTDISTYTFRISARTAWPVHVTARLIYRRTYKQWMDAKKLEIKDLEIAMNDLVINRRK